MSDLKISIRLAALAATSALLAGCGLMSQSHVHGHAPAPTPGDAASIENDRPESMVQGDIEPGFEPRWAPIANDTDASIQLAAADPEGWTNPYDLYAESIMGSHATSGEPNLGLESTNISQETLTEVGSDFDPTVSPDGQFIAFSSTRHNPSADIYLKRVGRNVLVQLTQDGGHDVMPAISPDNSRLAFASNRHGNWDIFVVDRNGGRPVRITDDATHELHPSWSPDGTRLVFSRLGRSTGRWELWVVEPDNPAAAHFVGYGLFPEWCPVPGTGINGADRIVFQRSRQRGERAFGVWTIDFAGDQAHRPAMLASSATNALINPTWSPNGDFVVYASVPNPSEWNAGAANRPAYADLWMVDVEGVSQVNLTKGSAVDMMPTWARSGKLYFVSNRSGAESLWSMDTREAVLAAKGSSGGSFNQRENSATVAAPTDN